MLLLRSPLEDDAGHKGFQQRTFFGSENVSGCGCTTKTANASSSALLHCTDQVIQKTQQLAITQRVLGFFKYQHIGTQPSLAKRRNGSRKIKRVLLDPGL